MLLWDGIEFSVGVFVVVYMNGCDADKAAFDFLTLYQDAGLAQLNEEESYLFSEFEEDSVATVI